MVQEIEGQQYLTAEEACRALGVKLPTLYSYVNRGVLQSYRQGIRRQSLYRLEDIDSLLRVTPVEREDRRGVIPAAAEWNEEH